jgi:hypothetical protein
MATGRQLRTFGPNVWPATPISAVSADCTTALTVKGDHKVQVWDVSGGTELVVYTSTSRVIGAGLSSNGRLAALLDDSGVLRLWRRDATPAFLELSGTSSHVSDLLRPSEHGMNC